MAIHLAPHLRQALPALNNHDNQRAQPAPALAAGPVQLRPNLRQMITEQGEKLLNNSATIDEISDRILLGHRLQISAKEKQIIGLKKLIVALQNEQRNQPQMEALEIQIEGLEEEINALDRMAASQEEAVEIAARFQLEPPVNATEVNAIAEDAFTNPRLENRRPNFDQHQELIILNEKERVVVAVVQLISRIHKLGFIGLMASCNLLDLEESRQIHELIQNPNSEKFIATQPAIRHIIRNIPFLWDSYQNNPNLRILERVNNIAMRAIYKPRQELAHQPEILVPAPVQISINLAASLLEEEILLPAPSVARTALC